MRRGRQRDESIDQRVLDAAVQVYARQGWGSFTYDAVAREARVGKPAIYRRWDSREELLGAALERLGWPVAEDHGSLVEDLRAWAGSMLMWWKTPAGDAFLRWQVDIRYVPTLAPLYDRVLRERHSSVFAVLRRAVARGELAPEVDHALFLELISGAVMTRSLAMPWSIPSEDFASGYTGRLLELLWTEANAGRLRPG